MLNGNTQLKMTERIDFMSKNKNLKTAANLLGVSYDKLEKLSENTQNSMAAVIDVMDVDTKENVAETYNELHKIWLQGITDVELSEISDCSGIALNALLGLPLEIKQHIIFDFALNQNVSNVYEIMHSAIAFYDLSVVADFIGVPVEELNNMSDDMKGQIYGMYTMEHGIMRDEELVKNLSAILHEKA